MGSSPAPSEFQTLYIEASTHARALKALNHNEENIKSTMLTLLPDKMPGDMKRLWFRETNGKDPATITLKSLYDFIELEMAINSRFKASSNQPQQHRPEPHQSNGRQQHKKMSNASCNKSCAHCLEGHHIYICKKMSDAAAAKAPTTASGWGGKKKKADTQNGL